MKIKIELILILIILVFNVVFLFNFKFTGFSVNEFSPHNFIEKEDIYFYKDKIVINLSNYVLSSYNSTKSMVPVLDLNANGVGIKPNSTRDLHVGDIISFWQNNELIVHRIIDIGKDSKGTYFITKGDNSYFTDEKVRFEEIDSVLVVLIY